MIDPALPLGTNGDVVRRDNLSAVLGRVHRSGGLSRSALTSATGLNRSTVGALVGELVERGLVTEGDPEPTRQRGRPSPQVLPNPGPVVIAINPEVDAVTFGLVGLGARVERRWRREVDHPIGPDETVAIIVETLRQLESELTARRVLGIGVAVPGIVQADDGLVRWAPHLGWTDVPLAALIAQETGIEASVGNDASLGAIAEHLFGAGRGLDDLVYLNGGASGIGGGVIVAGRPLGGRSGYAGEFGHNRPGSSDPTDRLSTSGALEDEVNRARLMRAAGLSAADEPTLRAALADTPSPTVRAELARQRRILAAAIANAINVLNPAVVLLGGFLATVRETDAAELDALVAAQAVPIAWADCRIESAALGDDLLMIGAAELVISSLVIDPMK